MKSILCGREAQLKETWIRKIGDLLFPKRCPLCDEVLGRKEHGFCNSCKKKIVYIKEPCCKKCGRSLSEKGEGVCAECVGKSHLFIKGRALFEYKDVAKAIYRYKYSNRREYATTFAKEVVEHLGAEVESWGVDALIPVPLHKKKKRQRGFNQAELLAKELGKLLDKPVYCHLVERYRYTVPQKELNERERQNNLKNAFKIGLNDVKLNKAMIIDDIYTTGQTIDQISKVLLQVGICQIYFITLAIGGD